jgi:hypothetical protein
VVHELLIQTGNKNIQQPVFLIVKIGQPVPAEKPDS